MTDTNENDQSSKDMPEGEEAPPPGTRAMAVLRWALVAAMAIVAAVALTLHFSKATGSAAGDAIYHCPMHPQIVGPTPGECPICGMNLVLRAEDNAAAAPAGEPLYACPMHPEVTSHDPNARCSICGMALDPVAPQARPQSADAGVAGLVPVELSQERVQLIGLRTAPAVRKQVPTALRTVGVLETNERGRVVVSARFSGWVEKLLVNETGQVVRAGQVVAHIYSPEVLQAQEELLNVLSWKDPAPAGGAATSPHPGHANISSALAVDARRRLALLGLAEQDIDGVVRSGKAQAAVPLRAPTGGHVVAKNVLEGAAVQPGAPLLELADLSTLWLVADIYEADLARVRVGDEARFTTAAYPAESFTAKVRFIYPLVDPGARTLRVRLELKNQRGGAGLKLRPGMYGDVLLHTAATMALMVPGEALVDTGENQYVFLALEGGRYEPRKVTAGVRRGGFVEITQGLAEGDNVVTTANFLLDSESRLQATLHGQAAPPKPAAPPEHVHTPEGTP